MGGLPGLIVREAYPRDRDAIVEFNLRLAAETEHKQLDRQVLTRGVAAALADRDRLRYWIAATDVVVGQAAVTREWSDWRNGWLWWFQSVYVLPERRGQGVFRRLHGHIRDEALRAPDVLGLRLYVEQDNAEARATYERLGLKPGGYHVYEELWTERFTAARG